MIKKTIAQFMQAFDFALLRGVADAKARDENLEKFFKVAYEDLREMVEEVAEADSRISIEERNFGFFISLNGEVLFRTAILKLSDRIEIKVDGERIFTYRGHSKELSTYNSSCKISLAIRNAIIFAFGREIVAITRRKINAL